MTDKPRVLIAGEGWRIVRLADGTWRNTEQRDWIEVADGADMLGQTRWTLLERKSAGVSDYARVVNALKDELLTRLEQEN